MPVRRLVKFSLVCTSPPLTTAPCLCRSASPTEHTLKRYSGLARVVRGLLVSVSPLLGNAVSNTAVPLTLLRVEQKPFAGAESLDRYQPWEGEEGVLNTNVCTNSRFRILRDWRSTAFPIMLLIQLVPAQEWASPPSPVPSRQPKFMSPGGCITDIQGNRSTPTKTQYKTKRPLQIGV